MNKSVLIGLTLFLIFAASFSVFLHDEIFNEIPGKQIFLDDKFEKEPGDFRPSNSNSILLSPTDNCDIESISLSHTAARLEDTVSIYVDGKDGTNCNQRSVEIKVYEKDWLFDDSVVLLSGDFIRNKATIDLEIGEDFSYLFEEWFEGDSIEIYFEVLLKEDSKLESDLIIVNLQAEGPLLQPANYAPIGKGCTNAWYIDEDCDSYGVAAQTVECRGDCGLF
ncbi:hypothetical protein FJZ21_02360 [Candidatus Pacearchaeota archaeon]|nr:hypothetical protein [Candidatus Pacearchaeota archaeon]